MTSDYPPGLNERFPCQKLLGKGGMSTVWLASSKDYGGPVAVKVFNAQISSDATSARRLRLEADLGSRDLHRALVHVFEAGSIDGRSYLVMEAISGDTLRERIRKDAPLNPETVLKIAFELASCLAALHREGISHRDIKPDNVLIQPDGGIRLLDLGIARELTATGPTETGVILGTVHYLAPEVCRGEKAGPAADIFCLGILLAECLSPNPLFPDNQSRINSFLHDRSRGKLGFILPDTLPSSFRSLLDSFLAADPHDRPANGDKAVRAVTNLTDRYKPSKRTGAFAVRRSSGKKRSFPLWLFPLSSIVAVAILIFHSVSFFPHDKAIDNPGNRPHRKRHSQNKQAKLSYIKGLERVCSSEDTSEKLPQALLYPNHRLDPDWIAHEINKSLLSLEHDTAITDDLLVFEQTGRKAILLTRAYLCLSADFRTQSDNARDIGFYNAFSSFITTFKNHSYLAARQEVRRRNIARPGSWLESQFITKTRNRIFSRFAAAFSKIIRDYEADSGVPPFFIRLLDASVCSENNDVSRALRILSEIETDIERPASRKPEDRRLLTSAILLEKAHALYCRRKHITTSHDDLRAFRSLDEEIRTFASKRTHSAVSGRWLTDARLYFVDFMLSQLRINDESPTGFRPKLVTPADVINHYKILLKDCHDRACKERILEHMSRVELFGETQRKSIERSLSQKP